MMPPLNRTVPELVEATGITDATLYAWRKQARAAGAVVPGDGQQADQWSSQDKFRVVLESASLNAAELAEYCRRKGLYVEQINAWREACEQANSLAQPSKTRREREEEKAAKKRIKQLERELRRKDAALAETAALLVYGPLRNNLGFSRVRVAYTAGEAIGPDLFTFYRSIGINLKQLYGSTETAVFVCLQPDNQARADTVGVPIRGVQIKVADNGEIMVKSAGLLKEYYKNPAATAEVLTEDGWYHTSDAGFLDAHGHLKIIDRVKDVGRIQGGANDGAMFAPKYVENKLKFFPHIKEVVALGDKREKVCVMVNIDFDAVGNWAERRNLPYAGYTDLAQKPEVYELIRDCIEKVNADLANDALLAGSQVSRFLVLHKELDADDGELTRTNKVRRGFIAEKYAALVDALYAGRTEQYIETQVKFEDGRTGSVSATLKLMDTKTFPPVKSAA